MISFSLAATAAAVLAATASAQTFQRLGGCPTLGCVFPPDQQDFLAGQFFDIRLEVHAPVNGSEATNGVPDENFTFTVGKVGEEAVPVTEFFGVKDAEIETWDVSTTRCGSISCSITYGNEESRKELIGKQKVHLVRRPLRPGRGYPEPSQRGCQSLPPRRALRAGRVRGYFDILQWNEDDGVLARERY